MEHHVQIDGHTPNDVADIALCRDVGEILEKYYPGHFWMVGCNHEAGSLHIELAYQEKTAKRFPYGYLLHIHNLSNPDVRRQKVMHAGGELLERYGLARGKATPYAALDVRNNGIDKSGEIR